MYSEGFKLGRFVPQYDLLTLSHEMRIIILSHDVVLFFLFSFLENIFTHNNDRAMTYSLTTLSCANFCQIFEIVIIPIQKSPPPLICYDLSMFVKFSPPPSLRNVLQHCFKRLSVIKCHKYHDYFPTMCHFGCKFGKASVQCPFHNRIFPRNTGKANKSTPPLVPIVTLCVR